VEVFPAENVVRFVPNSLLFVPKKQIMVQLSIFAAFF
jgi:hypothetical protein